MKSSRFEGENDQEPDISDIAEIFQILNNRSVNGMAENRPYSEYDAESIFPPLSLASVGNIEVESDRSKSSCLVNVWKRVGVSEGRNEKELGFGGGAKKVKKIEIQKVIGHNQKSITVQKPIITDRVKREEQVESKDFVVKTNVNNNEHVGQSTVLKITDFFSIKRVQQRVKQSSEIQNHKDFTIKKLPSLSPEKHQKEFSFLNSQRDNPKPNPNINILVEKNAKRRKTIEDLRQEIKALKVKKQQMFERLNRLKSESKCTLRQKLLKTNAIKLQHHEYQSVMYRLVVSSEVQKGLVPSIQGHINSLEEHKKKCSKKGQNRKQTHTDQQSVGNADNKQGFYQNLSEKRQFINHWLGKVQRFKDKVEGELKFYHNLGWGSRCMLPVPEQILQSLSSTQSMRDYIPLHVGYPLLSASRPSAHVDELTELQTFNSEMLKHQKLTLLQFAKFSAQKSKISIAKQLSYLFKMSKKLFNSSSSYFLQTTMAEVTSDGRYLLFGREKNDDYESLLKVMEKYEGFSQLQVRYIARVCLIVLEEIKVKVDIPTFLLPINVHFTQKSDPKFTNILMNNLFLNPQFLQYLKPHSLYYYVPPEAISQKDYSNLGLWSLGVLLYFIIYEKYPFEYELEANYEKETFWIYNELVFPGKPVVGEKLKDFITVCLMGKERDLTAMMRHQLFVTK